MIFFFGGILIKWANITTVMKKYYEILLLTI